MRFDFVIGNPPYQEDNENSVRKAPVYNIFMDAAFEVGNIVELITPGRFLFDAGQTPKSWNEKMLNDEHFIVLEYESDASRIFAHTEIKGGVIVSLRNRNKNFGKISVFTPYNELNHILKKVKNLNKNAHYMDSIVSQRGMYRFTETFFCDYPYARECVGKGTGNMIVSNILEKVPDVFEDEIGNSSEKYYSILGRVRGKRIYKYIKAKYIINNDYIDKYKLFFPEANGNGEFGEILTLPEIGGKGECSTDTFINIGLFDNGDEAFHLLNYIKTKFLRALLGVKKATQHSPKSVWSMIPLQDFTATSDIDWSQSIANIDKQLYKKYNLSDEEITFIETHVKEME